MNEETWQEKSFLRVRWAATLGFALMLSFSAYAQTVIFSEDFEGAFPGPWSRGDANGSGTPAYWSDVWEDVFGTPFAHSGEFSGYCAGIGYDGDPLRPYYQPYMDAFMVRGVDLAGYTAATLTFWYNIPSIEEEIDALGVRIDGIEIWFATEATLDWQQVTLNLNDFVGTTRTILFNFYSDFSIEGEGAYLDDIVLTASGATQQPNLTPYQPPGWSDKIVVSKVMDTTTDSSGLLPSDTLYLDWSVINNGSVNVTTSFRVELYVDDVLRNSWNGSSPLNPNSWALVTDYNLGTLGAGTHRLRIRADATDVVAESNENDNEYTKTIVISGSPDIRITPLTLGFNVTNVSASFAASEPAAPHVESGDRTPMLSPEQKLLAAHEVLERFDKGDQSVEVIVNLAPPAGTPRGAEWNSKVKLQSWQRAVKGRQDEVLSALEDQDFKPRRRFENQSGFSGTVTRVGLEKLVRHPKVSSIELSRLLKPHLAQGIPLMNAAIYRSSYNGAGVSVAIVDSGVDYNHPRLGGGGFPNSKVIGGYDTGDDDADPIPNATAHGTACAGIAAGALGTVGDYIGGVAPNAKIYALKVTSGGGSGAFDSDIIAAWNWCITHKNDDPDNPILVISTSFGGDRYFSNCDGSQSSYATAANNAVAAGITMLASSGNEGFCDSMGSPACISSIISVGGVFDAAYGNTTFCLEAESCAPKNLDGNCGSGYSTTETTQPDKITRYSNIASFLTLLAPAHRAYTTDIVGSGGYSSGDYTTSFGGTSAACPYAAGAVAALQSAAKSVLGRFLTPAEVRAKLVATGDLITDTKVAITKPRVNLGRAIETLGQNATFTIFNDGNAPLNVISIALESAAPWLSWSPEAPFMIDPGIAQVVALSVDPALAPLGESTRRLLVASSDADESPYPDGVFISVTNTDPRPVLTARLVNNRLVVSWPTNAAGYVLQSANTLPSGSWANVPTTPFVIGSNKYVTNNITPGNRFYRLHK